MGAPSLGDQRLSHSRHVYRPELSRSCWRRHNPDRVQGGYRGHTMRSPAGCHHCDERTRTPVAGQTPVVPGQAPLGGTRVQQSYQRRDQANEARRPGSDLGPPSDATQQRRKGQEQPEPTCSERQLFTNARSELQSRRRWLTVTCAANSPPPTIPT
jgi:hypothetical protein